MTDYPNSMIVKDALQLYFSKYHFANGGYDLKWFKIKLGPFFIPLPNIKDRVDAVKIHDLHHLITEYRADYRGEAQIAGWEIASGCGRYYMAWILNSGSFFYGLFFFPKALYNAFIRGRRCATNFYHHFTYDDHLLQTTVGELRNIAEPKMEKGNNFMDVFYFLSYSAFVLFLAWCFISAIFYFC